MLMLLSTEVVYSSADVYDVHEAGNLCGTDISYLH